MTTPDHPFKDKDEASLRGFGLGTAILTVQQLKDIHTLLTHAFKQLDDPTITNLLDPLAARLKIAGIDVEHQVPLRAFANRSIIDSISEARPSTGKEIPTLVNIDALAKVERAILDRKPVHLKVPDPENTGKTKEVRVWPVQILFHNIAWYLAYESMGADRLLTVTRLDRIRRFDSKLPQQRTLAEMQQSQQRLERLCRRTGGIFLGDNHHQQAELDVDRLSDAKIQQLLHKGTLERVRFRCSARVYSFIRTGAKRFPDQQMCLCGPLPSDNWTAPAFALQPDPQDKTHPYPVELLLPAWTVAKDIDFRRWLFGFGDGLRIEAPASLREEHRRFGAGIADLYRPQHRITGAASVEAAPEELTS
jgi:hypothetical protein